MAEARWIRALWTEATVKNFSLKECETWSNRTAITVCLDSKPVYNLLRGQVLTIKDKRLAIEMVVVKQDVCKPNIVARWIRTYQMLADGMTKLGAPLGLLRKTLKEGRTELVEDDTIKRWAQKAW